MQYQPHRPRYTMRNRRFPCDPVGSLPLRFLCPLLDTDGRPIWFEHPLAGPGMDVAVYPMPDFITDDDSLLIDAYTPAPTGGNDVRNTATVAQDVFVVGYPYGLESGFQMPLWIRGTIASEPSMYYPH